MTKWQLVLEGATVKKKRAVILHSASAIFEAGEVTAILGSTGCGKSTLVRAIAGLEPLTSGAIVLQNAESRVLLSNLHARERARYIATVLQRPGVFFGRTASENVRIVLQARGLPANEIESKVRELFEIVEFDGPRDRRVDHTFSGGEQARIALARAMALEPQFLFVDEALSAIDAPRRRRILDRMCKNYRKQHRGLVFVTHDQTDAFMYADNIALMAAGTFAAYGPSQQVYRQPPNKACGEFLGLTRTLRGQIESLVPDRGEILVAIDALDISASARLTSTIEPALGQNVQLLIRPEDISLEPVGVQRGENEFEAVVMGRIFAGSESLLVLSAGTSESPVELLATEGRALLPLAYAQPHTRVGARLRDGVAAVCE